MKRAEIIIICLVIVVAFFIGFYIISNNSEKITHLQNQINNLNAEKQQLENDLNNQKQQTEKNLSELESKKNELERLNNQMTLCEKDSDCTRALNGCCGSLAVNLKYKDLWENSQNKCEYACAAVFDEGYAFCESNKCETIYMMQTKCQTNSDCGAYDLGCVNKDYVERLISKEGLPAEDFGFKETNKWTCQCSDSLCERVTA